MKKNYVVIFGNQERGWNPYSSVVFHDRKEAEDYVKSKQGNTTYQLCKVFGRNNE